MNILRAFCLLIAGFDKSKNIGVIYHDGLVQVIENSMFISYMIKVDGGLVYAIDENYAGSRFFEWNGTRQVRDERCLGAVYIEQHNATFYIPCFGSDNIWVVSDQFETLRMVPTCHKPHGIYRHDSSFYVPCRDSDSVHIYDYGWTLIGQLEVKGGPRHLLFVNNDTFIITEFTCQIINYRHHIYRKHVDLTQDEDDVSCAEIRYSEPWVMASIRRENEPGELVLYDLELNEKKRILVGTTPRFFDIIDNTTIIVLDQDDGQYTAINTQTWESVISGYLGMNPQCFVVENHV